MNWSASLPGQVKEHYTTASVPTSRSLTLYVDIDELWCVQSARGDGDAVFREPAPGSPEAGGPVVGPAVCGHGGGGAGVVQPLPLPLPPPQLQAHPPARPVVPVQLDVVGGLVVGLHVARRAAPAEFLNFDIGTVMNPQLAHSTCRRPARTGRGTRPTPAPRCSRCWRGPGTRARSAQPGQPRPLPPWRDSRTVIHWHTLSLIGIQGHVLITITTFLAIIVNL